MINHIHSLRFYLLLICIGVSCTKHIEEDNSIIVNTPSSFGQQQNNDSIIVGIYADGPVYDNCSSAVDSLRLSGFNTVILWSFHVALNGDISFNNHTIISHGQYIGNANWRNIVGQLQMQPSSVRQVELSIGSEGVNDFENIFSLVKNTGTDTPSILYQNFKELLLITGAEGFDFDNEELGASYTNFHYFLQFAQMLPNIGAKHLSICPFTTCTVNAYNQLRDSLAISNPSFFSTIFLQCYGAGSINFTGPWHYYFPMQQLAIGQWVIGNPLAYPSANPQQMANNLKVERSYQYIQGGWVWVLSDILKYESTTQYSCVDYATAIKEGCQ